MKKTFYLLIGLFGVIGIFHLNLLAAVPTTELMFTLESRYSDATTNKVGYKALDEIGTNCCSPSVHYFRQKQRDVTWNCTWGTGDTNEFFTDQTGVAYYTEIHRRVNEYSDICVQRTGSYTISYYYDPSFSFGGTNSCDWWTRTPPYTNQGNTVFDHTGSIDCSYGFAGFYPHNEWDFAGYVYWDGSGYTIGGWWWWDSSTVVTSCNQRSTTNLMPTIGLLAGSVSGCATNTEVVTLSDEFTTEQMLDSMDLTITNQWLPKAHESDHATRSISEDEYSASGRAVQARFKVWAPTNEMWEIEYYSWHKASNTNAAVCVATNELKGMGTGGWQFIDVSVTAAYSTYSSNGCVFYQGEESWITVGGCGGGNSLCSSGTCSLSPGSVEATQGSVRVAMGLGASLAGKGSGSLLLLGSTPNPKLTMPDGLEPFGDLTGSDIVRTPSGAIRQILAPLCLADVVTNSATKYTVNFYYVQGESWEKVDGIYDTSGGTPFSTCIVEQVGSTNHIRITANTGTTRVYDFTWSAGAKAWALSSGGGIRQDVQSWDDVALIRTNKILNGSSQLVYQVVVYYTNLASLGHVIIRRVVGTGAAAQTNRWFYYDNSGTDGTNYGKLKLEIEPSGFWRQYVYSTNGLLTKEVSQFLNSATNSIDSSNRVVEISYDLLATNLLSSETRVEKLLGQEIGRQYAVRVSAGETRSIQCQSAVAAWNNSSNLVTITKASTTAGAEGKPASVLHPDGTMEIYSYDPAGTWHSISTGQPDAAKTNIVAGTRTETVLLATGEVDYRNVYDINLDRGSEIAIDTVNYTYNDALNRSYSISHLDGTSELVQYGCCGLELTQDRDGTYTYYYSDALNRQAASKRSGVITTNIFDAAGNVISTLRIGTDASQITLSQSAYDTAGRLTTQTNALNGVTTYTETRNGSGETVKTITAPDGGTRIETYFQDGSLKNVSGTAAQPVRYEYGVESEGGVQRTFTKEIKLTTSGTDTTEWTKSYTDLLGRNYKTVFAAASSPPYSLSAYNNAGQLVSQTDPDGVVTLFAYNPKGEQEYTAVDSNRNYTIDFSGTDRITRTVNEVTNTSLWSGAALRHSMTYQWSAGGSVLVNERFASVNGLHTASTSFGLTSQSEVTHPGSGARQITSTAPDGTYTISEYQDGRLMITTRYSAYSSPLQSQTNAYDPHGRLYQILDARNGVTTLGYNAADMVATNTTPDPDGAGGAAAQVTTTYYDTSLRATNTVQPDATSTYTSYYPNGQLKKTWGSRIYPVEYTYDEQGRMKTMKTWQNYASGAGAAITTWNYDAYRGWLASKSYADGTGPSYTYSAAGRLATRAWARGLTTTYSYNGAGDLSSADYSDSTPDVTYGYDRRGRQTSVAQAGGMTTSRAYTDAGQLLGEAYSGGALSGLAVTNLYDALLRRTNVSVLGPGSAILYSAGYSYDPDSGRLAVVNDGTNAATYSYLANSPFVENITFQNDGTTRMVTTRSYDSLNRLTSSVSTTNGTALASFTYGLNNVNQRTNITTVDDSRWVYTYDNLGQVTSGKKVWANGTNVAGMNFDYAFDDIGNRKQTKSGQDLITGAQHTANYWNNLLNQITWRDVPSFAGLSGLAATNATVTVDNRRALRQTNYWWAEAWLTNSAAPAWQSVATVGVISNASGPDTVTSVTGNVFAAKSPEQFLYDADGNLTQDGRWTNTWNGENRRTVIEGRSVVPVGGRVREAWTFLPDGRWIERIVSTNNGSYVAMQTNRFVWDENVLLAVLNDTNGLELAFMRGLDLSGTLQGAGGVGGLLAVLDQSTINSQPSTHFVANDGNGNVAALVNAADGTESARYEYGPFAERIRETGVMARANPIRYSTQYHDDYTEDDKYLFRDLRDGRWLSRDPIGEEGGMNVYGYVDNQPLGVVDPLGMAGLAYVSEGFAFRDPDFLNRPLGGLSVYSSVQSGIGKDTTAAHFSQSVSPWAESICNSGGSGSYSYVRAYIINASPCAYKVSARCSFSFNAAIRSTGQKRYKTSVQLHGHLLDDYFGPPRKDKEWTGPPTPPSGGKFNLRVQDSGVRKITALIEPGVKFELYHIYPQIAFQTGGIWSGDPGGFDEALSASCTISILETYSVYSIQLK